jgi:hypothetical protein
MADQRVYARTFSQTLTLVAGLFCLEKRVSYRRLRKEFDLDDEILNDRRADIGFQGSRLRARTGMTGGWGLMRPAATAERHLDDGKAESFDALRPSVSLFWLPTGSVAIEFRCGAPRSSGQSRPTAAAPGECRSDFLRNEIRGPAYQKKGSRR